MPAYSLGFITFTDGGGPIQATVNQTDPTAQIPAHAFWVRHLPGNTGTAYVGDSTLNLVDGTGVYDIVPAPYVSNPAPRTDIIGAAHRENTHNMANVYVHGTAGDTIFLGYITA